MKKRIIPEKIIGRIVAICYLTCLLAMPIVGVLGLSGSGHKLSDLLLAFPYYYLPTLPITASLVVYIYAIGKDRVKIATTGLIVFFLFSMLFVALSDRDRGALLIIVILASLFFIIGIIGCIRSNRLSLADYISTQGKLSESVPGGSAIDGNDKCTGE
ncbi:MAG: hypothetical protein MUO27_09365 [Sedimentisphaerales bacterium]|nr:hypothetical protein [Sedimentisphaerales bacterium]